MYNVEGIFDYRMCLWGLEVVVELKCKKLALFGGVENTLEHWVLVLASGWWRPESHISAAQPRI